MGLEGKGFWCLKYNNISCEIIFSLDEFDLVFCELGDNVFFLNCCLVL